MMNFKELADKLDRRYADDVTYVSGIIDTIQEMIDDELVAEMPEIAIEQCEKEEIDTGYWEYVGVDGIPLENFVDNPNEKSALILQITYDEKDKLLWIDIVPNVDSWSYYVGED